MIKSIYRKSFVVSLLVFQGAFAQYSSTKQLSIDEMFRLANENNKILKLANTGIKVSADATQLARNSLLPSVNVGMSLSYLGDATILDRNLSNSFISKMPHFRNSFSIEASQVVFSGGAITNSIEKAGLDEQIALLNLEKNKQDVHFMLVGFYLDLFKLSNQREVYSKNVEETKELIKQIEAKKEEGMALSNDVARYKLNLNNYELAITMIDNKAHILNNHLTKLIGIADSIQIKPDNQLLSGISHTIPQFVDNQTSVTDLPEMKITDLNYRVAEKQIDIAKSGYYPSIAIIAANHFDGPITIEVPTIDKNLNYWFLGVGVNYSISSLFTNDKSVALAENMKKVTEDERSIQEEQSTLFAQTAIIEYKEAYDKLNNYEKSLDLATENYKLINNRYLNDMILITEMLDASSSKLSAELDVANAKINILYNYYKLQRSIGKL